MTTLRIAHRGMPRHAPENTIEGFALALASGAQGIELDVHCTADGVVVVHHDSALRGGMSIAATTYLDVVDADPGIPTLESVCRLVGGRAELFVELKGEATELATAAVLDGHQGKFAVHSFDHAMIERLANARRDYRLGILLDEPVEDIPSAMRRAGALDLWPRASLASGAMIDEVHSLRGRVIAWTVNDVDLASRLIALGIDGVCTDDVGILAGL